jgi:polyhydroxybutyrate depolymerase
MSRISRTLAAFGTVMLLAVAGPAATAGVFDAIPGKPAPAPKPQTLTVAGRTRAYFLFKPPQVAQSAPVVMVLHGGMGEASNMRKLGFDELARRDGFVVVYPEAAEQQWNDGRTFTGRFAATGTVDDVGFFRALIDKLIADGVADPARIYVTGASNGGMMSFRLGCELGDRLAGIAPVIALMPEGLPARCQTRKPLPLLLFVGTEDQFIPVKGGAVMPFFSNRRDVADRGRVASLETTLAFWSRRNQCRRTAPPQRHWLPDQDSFDSLRTQVSVWPACAAPVQLYSIVGGGHQWPGSPARPKMAFADRFLGRGTTEIQAAPLIWDFFRQAR